MGATNVGLQTKRSANRGQEECSKDDTVSVLTIDLEEDIPKETDQDMGK
jgi:hypothetical protein